MNPEDSNEPTVPGFLTEDELRAELDAAERRKEEDLRKKSRIVSLVLCVPALLLLGAAAVFLLQYDAAAPLADKKAAPAPRSETAAPVKAAPGKIVDKSDLEFATRLLNFGNAADGPPAKGK